MNESNPPYSIIKKETQLVYPDASAIYSFFEPWTLALNPDLWNETPNRCKLPRNILEILSNCLVAICGYREYHVHHTRLLLLLSRLKVLVYHVTLNFAWI